MSEFPTVFGRGLLSELKHFVHRPFLVVTMEDLLPLVTDHLTDGMAGVHLVDTLQRSELDRQLSEVAPCAAVVGVGGGRAVDVAKYVAWSRRVPLFQVPTSMTVNAPFGHRAGLRDGPHVRYVGWAVPEAVYVDFDVIRTAPPALNRSGVSDVLCYHTAHRDWEIARDAGRCEDRWPYDAVMVAAARARLQSVLAALDDIHDVTDSGIRALMEAHRWGGATFADSGWNPRHIEGVEHFFFYNLERVTGRHFIHGQPVGLGIYAGSLIQDNDAEGMLDALCRAGVDIRPESMGITWDDVAVALDTLADYVRQAGLWFTVAEAYPIEASLTATMRDGIEGAYGSWGPAR